MVEIPAIAKPFADRSGWGNALCVPIAADMSARRYYRLCKEESSAVLMVADAPMDHFTQMTDWLGNQGLSVPKVLAAHAGKGLLLLEDFGDVTVKTALKCADLSWDDIQDDCISLLLRIRDAKPPQLNCPDPDELVEWTRLADSHYPGIRPSGLTAFRKLLRELLRIASSTPATVSLRDFHTENMMWLPERKAHLRLGLLDYQDAFLVHPAYDLVSLLTDARTWIPTDLRSRMISSYLERSGDEPNVFQTVFAALSAQRNLRILGVFCRAGRHLEHLPNTYEYFCEALAHPAFSTVQEEVLSALPPPGPA